MKKFEFPEMTVVSFEIEDIISNSNDELPFMPFSVVSDEFGIKPIK